MKELFKLLLIPVVVLIPASCEKEIDPIPDIVNPYAEIEKSVRAEYDGIATFPWKDYNLLLQKLSETKFVVLPLNEMRNHFDNSKVVVGLRHDIDHNPFKGLEMANIEKEFGIRSTYFILATARYYGDLDGSKIVPHPGMGKLYKELHATGAEIGIHNDLLTVMISYNIDPFVFNKSELSFYNSLDIPIYGTASHGSNIARATVPNYQIFSNFAKTDSISYMGNKYQIGIKSLAEFGFRYEAYFINFNTSLYFSDSGGKWNDPEGLPGILKKLDACSPGDRIQILAHPDWWGRPEFILKSDTIKTDHGF